MSKIDAAIDDPQWYAVRVMVQREYAVGEMLRRQGLATLIPTEIRSHKRSSFAKGMAEFAVPILPGLVFVGFPSAPAWYDLLERNHLIVAPFSLGTGGMPTRLSILKLLRFFGHVNDGCMVRDKDGLRLIHIPGRAPVRSLDTRVRTISARRRDERARPARRQRQEEVVSAPAPRRYADFLSRFTYGGTV